MTTTQEAALEKIASNWQRYQTFSKKTGNARLDGVNKLLEHFENRLAITPCSARKEYHGAYIGGLVDHSLRLTSNIINFNKVYNLTIPTESLLFVGLFHGIGKVGDLEKDCFLEQQSDWHVKQGIFYEFNKELSFMTVPHRTLFLLQHFGITLSEEEFTTILLSGDVSSGEESKYLLQEPSLTMLFQAAARFTINQTKQKSSVSG